MQITKDTLIGDVIKENQDAAEVFISFGMHCLGCACAKGESIIEACEVHGIDADELVAALNEKK